MAALAMLACVMLVVEIGRMYSVHRELRKLATLSALDAALAPGVLLGRQTGDAGLRVLDIDADADAADSVAVTPTRPFPTR